MNLGLTYKNRDAPRNFVHYIAEAQRHEFHRSLSSQHFYSILMDGSTDKGRVENELFVILFSKKDDVMEEVKTCARFLCVLEPSRADADGLIDCLDTASTCMDIENILSKRECS